ncbi:hypothetical protein P9X10_00960 [Bacillus cereus]|nr:hypothetical protein [Bacillus cereus]
MFGIFGRRKKKQSKVTLQQAFDRICEELDGEHQNTNFFTIDRQTGLDAYPRWQILNPHRQVLVTQANVRNLEKKKAKYFPRQERVAERSVVSNIRGMKS